jgi:hypothetical protein
MPLEQNTRDDLNPLLRTAVRRNISEPTRLNVSYESVGSLLHDSRLMEIVTVLKYPLNPHRNAGCVRYATKLRL